MVTSRTVNFQVVISMALAILFCSEVAAKSEQDQPYNSKIVSDVRLKAFEKANPDCPLWTDWRKICSRIGVNGATSCRTDPIYKVVASAPFCAARPIVKQSLASQMSAKRFCVKFRRALRESDDWEKPTGTRVCDTYQSARPFSGETIAQMEHPACLSWVDMRKQRKNVFCSDSPDKKVGQQSCKTETARRRIWKNFAPVCARWTDNLQCAIRSNGNIFDPPTTSEIVTTAITAWPSQSKPVWGLYCAR